MQPGPCAKQGRCSVEVPLAPIHVSAPHQACRYEVLVAQLAEPGEAFVVQLERIGVVRLGELDFREIADRSGNAAAVSDGAEQAEGLLELDARGSIVTGVVSPQSLHDQR